MVVARPGRGTPAGWVEWVGREDGGGMTPLAPEQVLERLAALPRGARLLRALDAVPALEGLHLVGGAVRDLLLGRAPAELDLVAERDGPAVADELRRRLDGAGQVHERFGTASVALRDGTRIDVATARAEAYPRPGALPVVRPGTLDEDLARRDFAVNAIAVGVSADRRGQVRAVPHALDDLAAGRLRVLHDASFLDDPTRLLRLVRYEARLRFAAEPATDALARAAVRAGAPATAGAARMGGELRLLLAETTAVEGLERLRELGGGGELVLHPGFDVDPPLLRRALALLPPDGDRVALLLAACAGPARGWFAAIHLPRPAAALDAARDPAGLAAAMRAADRPSALHALLRGRTAEAVALAGAHGAEEPARRWLGELRHVRPAVTGADLVAAGVPPGPEVGERLRRALAAKLDGAAPTREAELAAAIGSDQE